MANSSRDYGIHWSSCNLPVFESVYVYKASECKSAIIRLHCATSKSSLWNMEYIARGGAFEHPRIYCTNMYVHSLHKTCACVGWCSTHRATLSRKYVHVDVDCTCNLHVISY